MKDFGRCPTCGAHIDWADGDSIAAINGYTSEEIEAQHQALLDICKRLINKSNAREKLKPSKKKQGAAA